MDDVALKVNIKAIGPRLDIAPLSEGTSLQERSGMARIVEGFHLHTRTFIRK